MRAAEDKSESLAFQIQHMIQKYDHGITQLLLEGFSLPLSGVYLVSNRITERFPANPASLRHLIRDVDRLVKVSPWNNCDYVIEG
mmetsp:Transcript_15456/g.31295  ORF Transcript_15456/g.31295 Transcript_15456/m.31295 type:complete len:85 (+) Transcript_15456:164-418(+)